MKAGSYGLSSVFLTFLIAIMSLVGPARSQERPGSGGAPRVKVARVLSLVDARSVFEVAGIAAAVNPSASKEYAVAMPRPPEPERVGLAFAGAVGREIGCFSLGFSLVMGMGFAALGDPRQFEDAMRTVVRSTEVLHLDEATLQKARTAMAAGIRADPEAFQALANDIASALTNPRESIAYGIGLGCGQMLLGLARHHEATVRNVGRFLETLATTAREQGIENPIVGLAGDLVMATASGHADPLAVQQIFARRLKEIGMDDK